MRIHTGLKIRINDNPACYSWAFGSIMFPVIIYPRLVIYSPDMHLYIKQCIWGHRETRERLWKGQARPSDDVCYGRSPRYFLVQRALCPTTPIHRVTSNFTPYHEITLMVKFMRRTPLLVSEKKTVGFWMAALLKRTLLVCNASEWMTFECSTQWAIQNMHKNRRER